MPLYNYACPVCGVFEQRGRMSDAEVECACGQQATRLSVYHFGIGGVPPPRYRVSEFQEAAQEANYYHGRMEETKGEFMPRVDAVKEAKRKARSLGAKVK